MDNAAYDTFTSAITSMVQEAENAPRNILKSWGEMRAADNAAEAFIKTPEDDPKVRMIIKACGGQFQASIGDWLKGKRKKKRDEAA